MEKITENLYKCGINGKQIVVVDTNGVIGQKELTQEEVMKQLAAQLAEQEAREKMQSAQYCISNFPDMSSSEYNSENFVRGLEGSKHGGGHTKAKGWKAKAKRKKQLARRSRKRNR